MTDAAVRDPLTAGEWEGYRVELTGYCYRMPSVSVARQLRRASVDTRAQGPRLPRRQGTRALPQRRHRAEVPLSRDAVS